jgi:hypothetical protein
MDRVSSILGNSNSNTDSGSNIDSNSNIDSDRLLSNIRNMDCVAVPLVQV